MKERINYLYDYDGKVVNEFTLSNDVLEVSFINIGATITRFVDLKTNRNVVLAYDDYETYQTNPYFMGCVVGRSAGRIQDGQLIIDDDSFSVTPNFLKKHNLHTGKSGFQYKVFDASICEDGIEFVAKSLDSEDGFPGTVDLSVTYQLIDNQLSITYEAKTDKTTIINLTNHTYFNLNEDQTQKITNHALSINADHYLELNHDYLPGKKCSVEGTPLDFRKPKLIGVDFSSNHPQIQLVKGFDHPFVINQTEEMNYVATVSCEDLLLDVYSDQDAVIFYSGNALKSLSGLCLETQGIPNNTHIDEFKSRNVLKPNQTYIQQTIWTLRHK